MLVAPTLRSTCLDVAAEAARAQQPPMQFVLRGAAGPAIPRLMQVAIVCQEHRLMDPSKSDSEGDTHCEVVLHTHSEGDVVCF